MALLTVEEALARVLALVTPLEPEVTPVEEALGRALAEPLEARRTLPPWDNSAMDGYAVRAEDLARLPATLRVTSTLFAGQQPTVPVSPGAAARIMTGAPMPPGADTVVMQEKTRAPQPGVVEIVEAPRPGANVRRRGEDVAAGAPLFDAGREVGLAEAGALWAQGLTEVPVRRRPRVALAASGDELADLGSVDEGRIIDTNSPVLAAAVRKAGGAPTRLGRAPDELDALTALFARGLEHDVLIAVAGASVGEKDFTREALARLGVTMDFWKVAMKPGKPLAVGTKGRTLVFGLPGNPVSALVTFELFVRPALRALQGLSPTAPVLPARAGAELRKPPGLRHFLRATTQLEDGALVATPLPTQSSGAMASATGATCLIALPSEVELVPRGGPITVLPLAWLG